MTADTWKTEQERAVQALRQKLEKKQDCLDLVDAYGEMMRSLCEFTTRLLGPAGTRAILSRAIKLASRQQPLVAMIMASHVGPELGDLRAHVAESGCSSVEVINALVELGVTILNTLSDLAGDALTGPFIQTLETE